ncbi:MAG: hypothetical protein QOG72_343 [Sphingomonadales bacterium]|jgi:hypothetical protein|nr:hypothetical protein [Sphingomonadales bacterium]
MSVTGGRVVVTPGEAQPYKVVLEHERTNDTEHPVATVSEGELYIRSKRPFPPGGAFEFGNCRKSPADRDGRNWKSGLGRSPSSS